MGNGSIQDGQSRRKRRWSLALCSLMGLQMSGVCWSDDAAAPRVQKLTPSAASSGSVEGKVTDGLIQVGHHANCNDPNCQQCRPKKRKWCPPEWYTESPLWQNMNADGNAAGAAANQGMGAANQGGNMNTATPGFGEYASASASDLAPNMIGDLFGPGGFTLADPGGGGGPGHHHGGTTVATGRVGQLKMAENFSPMPRDRVFLNYSMFNDAQFTRDFNANVNRFTPGFEKTFMDGGASFELRAPFASTLDPTTHVGSDPDTDKVSWGNLLLAAKFIAYRTDTFVMSSGVMVGAPTARDTRVIDGTDLLRVYNRSTHVMPYVSTLFTPNDRMFSQGIIQFDQDVNGSPVYADVGAFGIPAGGPMNTDGLTRVGKLQEAPALYTSFSVGYWSYLADSSDSLIQGVAPTFEIHSSTTLKHGDFIQRGTLDVGSHDRHTEVINLVLGLQTRLRNRRFVSAAYAFPVSGQADRQFQGEFRLLLNQYFGPITRQTTPTLFGGG